MYKIIYPSITENELEQFNEKINNWFIAHRDTNELNKMLNIEYETYNRMSFLIRKRVLMLMVPCLGMAAYFHYSNHTIGQALMPMIAAVMIIVIAIFIESRFLVQQSTTELELRIEADTNIKTDKDKSPLDFTMYDIPAKAFLQYDFSNMKRVHMYTDIINKLIWFKSQNSDTATDIHLNDDTIELSPIVDGKHPLKLIVDKDMATVYANSNGENIIDFTKLQQKIESDVASLA